MADYPVIRNMTVADVPEIIMLQDQCGLSPWSPGGYKAEIENDSSLCLIAESYSEIAGFLIAGFTNMDATAEIYNIGVREHHRRSNIGTRLLDRLKAKAFQSHVTVLFLEVRISNHNAIAFYKKHLFDQVGMRKNFYSDPTEDAIIMRLDISKR